MTQAAAARDLLLDHLGRALRLADIGARRGTPSVWQAVGPQAEIFGFEPDPQECARLNRECPSNVTHYPVALGAAAGDVTLVTTREPGCSSIYAPMPAIYERYATLDVMTPVGRQVVPCRRLDDFWPGLGAGGAPDVIKLDTQGSELDILRGGIASLAGCALVDVEVEFNALYQDQPLFCHVDAFLREQGFVLWRFSDLVHYAPVLPLASPSTLMLAHSPGDIFTQETSGGQIFWGQAHYVRAAFPASAPGDLPHSPGLAAAAVMGIYGYWDIA